MAEPNPRDERDLIDCLLGQADADTSRRLAERAEGEPGLRRLRENLDRAFRALRLAPDAVPPEDLTERTLRRVRSARQTEALIAREQTVRRPPAHVPTFTFREAAVAAAAVLLLAALFIPSLREARSQARIHECASQAGQIGAALISYANENDGVLPTADGTTRRWLPGDHEVAASNSSALFKLLRDRYVASPTLFQCPATRTEPLEVQASMTDFPAGKFIAYSFHYSVGGRGLRINDPALAQVVERMAVLADSTPVFRDGKFLPDRVDARGGDNHGGKGQNVLYLGGQVRWASTPDVGVGDDNIYLVRGVKVYRGEEAPADSADSFLLPSSPTDAQGP